MRPATEGDAGEIAALVHSAYRSEASRTGWTTEADLVGGQRTDAAMVADLVRRPENVVLVGFAEGVDGGTTARTGGAVSGARLDSTTRGPLACCHLERRGLSAYLGMFAVRPGLQGRGVGRAMLEAAQEHASRTWGTTALSLTVLNRRPELIAWYERRGFVLTGEEHAFPYGDRRFGIPHRPDLVLLAMSRPVATPSAAEPQPSIRSSVTNA